MQASRCKTNNNNDDDDAGFSQVESQRLSLQKSALLLLAQEVV
jgi:hypothetical protein